MKGMIDGIDFFNMEAMKYYSVPNTWSEEKKKDNATSKIFSGDWWGAQKRDGIFMMTLCDEDDNVFFRPRSKNVKGEFVDKSEWVPHLAPFFKGIPNGTCFLGELYLPRDEQAKSTSSIMNCLKEKAIGRQNKEEDKLHYYIFDILAHEGKSLLDTPAIDRFDLLKDYEDIYKSPYLEWATYKNGKELWDMLQDLLAEGYEGVVITNAAAHYQPGKRSNSVSLKIKKELQDTIDCVVIGANPPTRLSNTTDIENWIYWENLQTNEKIQGKLYKDYKNGLPIEPVTKGYFYGWCGSLKLGLYDKNNKLIHVGDLSGITEEIKCNWKDYVGRVVEISAMEIMNNAQGGVGFRHPKLHAFRQDKPPQECILAQIL